MTPAPAAVTHYYRLRPGVQHPAFRAGELYRFIEETQPTGYVFVELAGRPRCVREEDFERIDEESGSDAHGEVRT